MEPSRLKKEFLIWVRPKFSLHLIFDKRVGIFYLNIQGIWCQTTHCCSANPVQRAAILVISFRKKIKALVLITGLVTTLTFVRSNRDKTTHVDLGNAFVSKNTNEIFLMKGLHIEQVSHLFCFWVSPLIFALSEPSTMCHISCVFDGNHSILCLLHFLC